MTYSNFIEIKGLKGKVFILPPITVDSKIQSSTDKCVFRYLASNFWRLLSASDYCRALFCCIQRYFLSLESLPSFPGHVSTPLWLKLRYFSAEDSWQSSSLNWFACTSLSRLSFEHNRPFYSCLFSDLALEWQRGWS